MKFVQQANRFKRLLNPKPLNSSVSQIVPKQNLKQNSNIFFLTESERNKKRQEQERNKDKNKNKNTNKNNNEKNKNKNEKNKNTNKNKNENKNTNNRTRTKHEPQTNYKEKELDKIEPVSRAEALIPDDVILTRSRSLDISHRVWVDATFKEGRKREGRARN